MADHIARSPTIPGLRPDRPFDLDLADLAGLADLADLASTCRHISEFRTTTTTKITEGKQTARVRFQRPLPNEFLRAAFKLIKYTTAKKKK